MSMQKYVDRLIGFKTKESARAIELQTQLDKQAQAIGQMQAANAEKDALIANLLEENASLKGENASQKDLIAQQQAAIEMFDAAFDQVEESQAAISAIDNTPFQTEVISAVIESPEITTPDVVMNAPEYTPSVVPDSAVVDAAIVALVEADTAEY